MTEATEPTIDELAAQLRAHLDEDEATLREVGDDGMERTFPRLWRDLRSKRLLITDLLAEGHFLSNREWYGCRSIDEDGQPTGEPCTCGRDDSVRRRLALLALTYDATQ